MSKPHGYLAGLKRVIMAPYCPFGHFSNINPVYEAVMAVKPNNDPFITSDIVISVIIDPA